MQNRKNVPVYFNWVKKYKAFHYGYVTKSLVV